MGCLCSKLCPCFNFKRPSKSINKPSLKYENSEAQSIRIDIINEKLEQSKYANSEGYPMKEIENNSELEPLNTNIKIYFEESNEIQKKSYAYECADESIHFIDETKNSDTSNYYYTLEEHKHENENDCDSVFGCKSSESKNQNSNSSSQQLDNGFDQDSLEPSYKYGYSKSRILSEDIDIEKDSLEPSAKEVKTQTKSYTSDSYEQKGQVIPSSSNFGKYCGNREKFEKAFQSLLIHKSSSLATYENYSDEEKSVLLNDEMLEVAKCLVDNVASNYEKSKPALSDSHSLITTRYFQKESDEFKYWSKFFVDDNLIENLKSYIFGADLSTYLKEANCQFNSRMQQRYDLEQTLENFEASLENLSKLSEKDNCLIIDIGSCYIRAGFANDSMPSLVFPTVVGVTKQSRHKIFQKCFIGDEVQDNYGLSISYPARNATIHDYDDLIKIFDYIFKRLEINSMQHRVIIIDAPFNRHEREEIVNIMFRKYEVPSLLILNQTFSSLMSIDRETGLILNMGDGISSVASYNQGEILTEATKKFNLTGSHVTNYLEDLLKLKGYNFRIYRNFLSIIRDIKENFCYTAWDYDKELTKANLVRIFEMIDEKITVILEKERFKCQELLFKPSLNGLSLPNITQIILDSVKKTLEMNDDSKVKSIVLYLSGGASICNGFRRRLQRELDESNFPIPIDVIRIPNGSNAAWVGASRIARLPSFKDNEFLTIEEFYQNNKLIIDKFTF